MFAGGVRSLSEMNAWCEVVGLIAVAPKFVVLSANVRAAIACAFKASKSNVDGISA